MYIWNNNNYKIGVTVLSKNEKCKSLFYFVAVTLIFITPVSAVNLFDNGDFQTGSLSPWVPYGGWTAVETYYGDYHLYVSANLAETKYAYQSIDLTNVNNITFELYSDDYTYSTSSFFVSVNESTNKIWQRGYNPRNVWTEYTIDVSGYTGVKNVYFGVYSPGLGGWGGYDEIFAEEETPPAFNITFNPDYNETNSTVYPDVDITLGLVPSWPYYHVKLYYYQWINNSWGAKTLYTYKEQEWPRDTVSYFSVIEDGQYGWPTFPNLVFKKKLQVDLVYPGNNSVVATDSYIYDPDYVPPPPPPEDPPEDPPEPNATAEPTPGPDPEPPEEPPTGPGANQTLNVSWVAGYNDKVNNTVDYLFEPIYNFSYQVVYPVILLNTSLGDFKVSMNQTLNNASVSIGISTTLLFIVMEAFPQKLINVMLYYFIWLIILIIFKGDM